MDNQEATERMAIGMLERLAPGEKKAVFRCIRAMEKVMRSYGKLSVLAMGILAVKIQAGQRPGNISLEAEGELPDDDREGKMVRINLTAGGFDEAEIEAMIAQCRQDQRPLQSLLGLKKQTPPPPDGQNGTDDPPIQPGG